MKSVFICLALTVTLLFSVTRLTAQQGDGGRAAGMADAGLNLNDLWSVFQNQAGLAQVQSLSIGIFNQTPFMMGDLSTRGLAVAVPVNNGTLAAQFQYYGYSLYNEKSGGLAYARKLTESVSAGLQLDYFGVSIAENYGSANAVTFEAGLQAELMDGFFLAAHVNNPIRAKIADYNDERLPSILRFGLAYLPSEKVTLAAEAEKEIDRPNRIKAGIEYQVAKQLYLRTGIASNPVNTTFGLGLILDTFRFDVATSYHRQLGYSSNVSLVWIKK
ncbi:MAG: hypothetical protein LC117_11170 [Bacteroidia bacterium]|nr:hypothetical protein [Bacteroidia bacterium]MCZ2278474.1 hypothetical protein [Bacteroidia bacterium]